MRAVIDKQDVELSDEARRDVVAAGWLDDERDVLHFDYSAKTALGLVRQ